jgi:hypothetical protein
MRTVISKRYHNITDDLAEIDQINHILPEIKQYS